jgi:hypothetical protein
MPSFQCKCGERLDIGQIPNPNEWLAISDVDYDGCSETVDAEALYEKFTHFLKCGSCGRLWFFWNGFDQPPECYEKNEDH